MNALNTTTSLPVSVFTLSWLVEQKLAPSVASLSFERLKHKYTETTEAEMTEKEWDFAEQEYRRFLTLKLMYPNVSLVPSKVIDKVWHVHILDTRAYREDCAKVFGRFIDHYPYFGIYGQDDYQMLQEAFAETVELYERHFGEYPGKDPLNATRCQDHACHVPTSCACRVEGACK